MVARLAEERAAAKAEIQGLKAKLESLPEFLKLSEADRAAVLDDADAAIAPINSASLIAMVRERVAAFRTTTYPQLLSRATSLASKPAPVKHPTGEPTFGPGAREPSVAPLTPPPPAHNFIAGSSVKVSFPKPYLANEADVEDYLNSMREALLGEIRGGNRITV